MAIPNYNDFLYGMCGGFVGTIISHPFDTVKTRIQSKSAPDIKSAIMMRNLYAGITPPLIGIMLEKSIVFGFYNKSKEYGLNNFWSGIVGGFMCTLIVTPVDRVKIIFQNKESIAGFSIKSLYRGFIPTICRETPGFGIYFTTYNYLSEKYNKDSSNPMKTFTFGALSGLSAWTFIYPSDLVKTRMQSENNIKSQNIILQNYIRDIFLENNSGKNNFQKSFIGLKNFYKGFSLAIMRAMPLHGGVFLGYELSKKYI